MATKVQAAPRENTNRREVYDYVAAHPGSTSVDVSYALDMTHNEVSGPLSQLYAEGKLERQKVPGSYGKYAYFIPDRERPVERIVVTEPPRPNGSEDALRRQCEELEQWKADAIAKHPDLAPVDPILLKARELAAETLRAGGFDTDADDTLNGRQDSSLLVGALVKALQGATVEG